MIKRCDICGKEFEIKGKAIYCSDECRKLGRQAYLAAYRHSDARKAYNREWMHKYRGELGNEEVNRRQKELRDRKKKVNDFEGLNYAERQKQRTLELVGRVQI